MSDEIEGIMVLVRCPSKEPFAWRACADPACERCRGTGRYQKEIALADLKYALRDEGPWS